MCSFPKRGMVCIGLAITVCFTTAPFPATAQHTEHAAQDSAKKMPMKMPMGAATKKKQSKKPAAKSATKKRTTASKAATKAADTSHQNMPGMEPGAGHADSMRAMPPGMPMPTRDFAGGRFQARTMLSLDPFTVTKRGYPLLLQTGEAYRGDPLHDRQHPHDFWMELGALYQREINKKVGWSVYAAPSGEPALGPVAFMHRPSAMDNTAAPIAHHWQDATHVSFGVITAGIFSRQWQVEGSFFNGREPDDNRWNFDTIKLDSYSGRLTINPTAHWSFAAGYGFLKSPEALNPAESMHRVTASLLYGARLGTDGEWSSALIWGANKHSAEPSFSNSFLFESEAILDRSSTFFGRTELVKKSAEDLVVDNPVVTRSGVPLPGFPATQQFNLGTAQLGYIRELARLRFATIGLGGAVTLNFLPNSLEPYYGSRTSVGTFVFLRLRPFHGGKTGVSDRKGLGKLHNTA